MKRRILGLLLDFLLSDATVRYPGRLGYLCHRKYGFVICASHALSFGRCVRGVASSG